MRFPEFTDEWVQYRFGDLFSIGSSKRVYESQWRSEGVPFYRTREIISLINGTKFSSPIYIEENLFNELINKYGHIETGDLLVTGVGSLGHIYVVEETDKFYIKDGNVIWFKRADTVDSHFFKYLFKSKLVQSQIFNNASITTVGTYTIENAKKTKAFFPSKDEQVRIAHCLTLIDERLATQSKIIDKLQSLMSGIVVSHFNSCNTKSTISIKDLGEAYSVGNLSKDDLSEEGKPCILYGELFTTYGCVACEAQNRTNKYAQATLSRAGDLLFPASTTVDAISLIAPTSLQTDGVYVAGDMFGIHISPQYKSEYISYLLNYVYNRKLSKYAQGSTIIHLHYADVKNATIQVPCLEEQNKCARLLEALQTKLDIAKQLIDCYQTQKSYLLQRMFI